MTIRQLLWKKVSSQGKIDFMCLFVLTLSFPVAMPEKQRQRYKEIQTKQSDGGEQEMALALSKRWTCAPTQGSELAEGPRAVRHWADEGMPQIRTTEPDNRESPSMGTEKAGEK